MNKSQLYLQNMIKNVFNNDFHGAQKDLEDTITEKLKEKMASMVNEGCSVKQKNARKNFLNMIKNKKGKNKKTAGKTEKVDTKEKSEKD